jgi:hypothetical protein
MSLTVTDKYERFQWDRNTRLHNSFFCGSGRMAQPVSSLSSSICIVFCIVVDVNESASLQKSGISLLAVNHQRCMLCWESKFQVGVMIEVTLTTESKWTTHLQADMLAPN